MSVTLYAVGDLVGPSSALNKDMAQSLGTRACVLSWVVEHQKYEVVTSEGHILHVVEEGLVPISTERIVRYVRPGCIGLKPGTKVQVIQRANPLWRVRCIDTGNTRLVHPAWLSSTKLDSDARVIQAEYFGVLYKLSDLYSINVQGESYVAVVATLQCLYCGSSYGLLGEFAHNGHYTLQTLLNARPLTEKEIAAYKQL